MSFEEEKHNQFKMGQILIKKAQKLISKRNYTKAREILHDAQKIFEFTQSSLTEAQVYALIAQTYEWQHKWNKALDFHQKTLEKRKIAGNVILLSETHRKIALTQIELENFDEAHESAQHSIDLVENLEHPISKAEAFHTQGIVYLKERDYASALFYENFAYENIQKQFTWNLALDVYENLAFIHHELADYTQSNIFCKKALEMEQKQRNYVVISIILDKMAVNYGYLGEKEQALNYIKDALAIQDHLPSNSAGNQKNQINLHYAFILFEFHNLSEAEIIVEKIIENAEINQQFDVLFQGLLLLIKIVIVSPSHEEFNSLENYLKEAMNLAQNHTNLEDLSDVYKYYGKYFSLRKKDLQAEEMFQFAIDTALQSKSHLKIGDAYEQLGLYFHTHNKIELACSNFKQAVQYLSKTSNKMELAEAHYNLACVSSVLHLGEDILTHLTHAINLNPKFKQIARNDEDFAGISNEEVFRNLVE